MTIINRFTINENGALVITGNTFGLSKRDQTIFPGELHSINQFITTSTVTPTTIPGWTDVINLSQQENITSNWQENSSSAYLNMLSGYEVLYAELIWAGMSKSTGDRPQEVVDVTPYINNPVLLTTPLGNTIEVPPTTVTAGSAAINDGNIFYCRSQDITSIVKTYGVGKYTVGRVPSAVNIDEINAINHAGWTMIVAYKNENLTPKRMSIYVGENLVDSDSTLDVPISGFLTPPSGPLLGRLLVSAQEGDAPLVGDRVYFGPNISNLYPVSGPNNPVNNFFASQINIGDPNNSNVGYIDTTGTFGSRNPNPFLRENIYVGRQGWDITNVDVSNGLINNQNSAVARFQTSQGAYAVNALGLSIETILIDGIKSVDKDTTNLGEILTYTVKLTNQGALPQSNIVFRDSIPSGTTFIPDSITVSTSYTGNDIQNGLNILNIEPGQTVTIIWQVRVNDTLPSSTTITNVGEILVTSLPAKQTNTVTTKINTADLSISKTVNKTSIIPGDTISYTLAVKNLGPDTSYDVNIADAVSNLTDVLYSVIGQVTLAPWNGFYQIASLASGQSVTISLQGIVSANQTNTIVNTATVSSLTTADPNTINNISTVTTALVPTADLVVTKGFSPNPVTPGRNLTYTISVINKGPSNATNVKLIDTISGSLDDVVYSIDGGLTFNTWSGVYNIGTLAVNFLKNIIIVGRVKSSILDSIPNTAIVTSSVFDPVTINNIVSTTSPVRPIADLSVEKSLLTLDVTTGGTIVYSNIIRNNGSSDALNVVLQDTLPNEITNPEYSIDELNWYTWNDSYDIGTLINQESTTVFIRGTVLAGYTITNYATVSSSTYDPNLLNNYSRTLVNPIDIATLTAFKSASPNPVVVGDTLSYTIVVCNIGPDAAQDVVIKDSIANLELMNPIISVNNGPSEYFTGEFGIGTLDSNQCQTLSITGIVRNYLTGEVTNTAYIESSTTLSNITLSATTTVEVDSLADISVVKTQVNQTQITPISIYASELEEYNIVVSNSGPSKALDVVLYDILSEYVVDASISADGGLNYQPFIGSYTVGDMQRDTSQSFIIRTAVSSSAIKEIVNTATVVSRVQDPNTINNISTVTTPIISAADIYVYKEYTIIPSAIGDTLVSSIIVGNNGPSDSINVILYNTIIDNIINNEYSTDNGLSWINWNSSVELGTIVNGTTKEILRRGILASIPEDGIIRNIAEAYGETFDPDLGNNIYQVELEVASPSELVIYKYLNVDTVIAGTTIAYNIEVTNLGPTPAHNVEIKELLVSNILNPEYAINNSQVYNPWKSVFTTIVMDVNETITLSIRGILSEGTTGSISNLAIVRSDDYDPNEFDNSYSVEVLANAFSDLEITKVSSPNPVSLNEELIYTLYVKNNGPSVAQGIITYDDANSLDNVEFSINGGFRWYKWEGFYETQRMLVNESYTLLIRGIVSITNSDFIKNVATVTSLNYDPNPDNNTVIEYTSISSVADVQITKTSPTNIVSIGEELIYTLTITNNGPSSAENVIVYDENIYSLSNVKYSLNNGATWNIWNGYYNIGTMINNQSITILIKGFVYDSGSQYIKNVARVTTSTYDPNPNNNTAIEYTKIKTYTDLLICQEWCKNTIIVSSLVQFVLRVCNNGPNNASNIIINNDVSSFLYNPEYSIDGGITWNSYNGSVNISNLYPCESIDILIRGKVIFTGNNYITNIATVFSDNEDSNVCNNTSKKIIKLISYDC